MSNNDSPSFGETVTELMQSEQLGSVPEDNTHVVGFGNALYELHYTRQAGIIALAARELLPVNSDTLRLLSLGIGFDPETRIWKLTEVRPVPNNGIESIFYSRICGEGDSVTSVEGSINLVKAPDPDKRYEPQPIPNFELRTGRTIDIVISNVQESILVLQGLLDSIRSEPD